MIPAVTQEVDLDPEFAPIVSLLRAPGADQLGHGGGRSLLEHLVGTCVLAARWRLPAWLQRAALIHSVYGTDAYHQQLIPLASRAEVAAVAGERAERLAYLFGVLPRRAVLGGAWRWTPSLPQLHGVADGGDPTDAELRALVALHMVNLAEQARSPDGSPGRWLEQLGALAELLEGADDLEPPPFVARLAELGADSEQLVGRAYREGLGRGDDPSGRARRLALAAAVCPVVAEPCVWLAYLSAAEDDGAVSRAWADEGRRRLLELGTAWDKRLTFEQWHELVDALVAGAGRPPTGVVDPRGLLAALVANGSPAASTPVPGDPDAGRRRFQRYVEGLALACTGSLYPDLSSRPWHDPSEFPLVAYLESNFEVVRSELLAAADGRFQRESERIARTGDWDVAFLYERGRRDDAVCDACPVTVRGIESHPTIRTGAGLIYVSRLRPGTHIAAHRGPTNLRLRCHLGLSVPDGDCAIRVGDETRGWTEGRCIVFDDRFEHEAWNHADSDRLVLIVDLWHPGLSSTEVTLLEGLQRYAAGYASRLDRYWEANEAAAAAGARY